MVSSEVISCIDAEACKVMSLTSYYISIGVFVAAGIFLVMLFFVAFWTPALAFLTAKMGKNPIIYIVNRGQSGRFAVGKAKSEGILDVRGTGPFIVTENSHTREHKSGLPVFIAFGEFAATTPLRWVFAINKIRDHFRRKDKEIKNISDLGEHIGKKYNEATGLWT